MRVFCFLLLSVPFFTAGCGDDDGMRPRRDSGMDSGGEGEGEGEPDAGSEFGACGSEREPCCRGTLCEPGMTCSAGPCTGETSCGHKSQPCCTGDACESGLVCTGATCEEPEMCGTERAACCAG